MNQVNTTCQSCPANTYQADDRKESINHDNKEDDCLSCLDGLFSDSGDAGCSSCAAGQTAGAIECVNCQPGQVSSSKTNLKCENCTVGYYQNEEGLPSCIRCIPGQYQGLKGKTNCEECQQGRRDAGKWPTRNASTVCEKCESTDS